MTTEQRTTRVKRSFSISVEAVNFVHRVRKERKIRSVSETVDQLLKESMAAQGLSAVNGAYKRFYDEAAEDDLTQENDWAAFGETELMEIAH